MWVFLFLETCHKIVLLQSDNTFHCYELALKMARLHYDAFGTEK